MNDLLSRDVILPALCLFIGMVMGVLSIAERLRKGESLRRLDWFMIVLIVTIFILGTWSIIHEYRSTSLSQATQVKWDSLKHTPITGLTVSIGHDAIAAQDTFIDMIDDTSIVVNFISGHQWALKLFGNKTSTNFLDAIEVHDQAGKTIEALITPYTYWPLPYESSDFHVKPFVEWASSQLNWGNTNLPVYRIDIHIPRNHLPLELRTVDDARQIHEFRIVARQKNSTGRFFHHTPSYTGAVTQVIRVAFNTPLGTEFLPIKSETRELTWMYAAPDPIKYCDIFIPGNRMYEALRAVLLSSWERTYNRTNDIVMGDATIIGWEKIAVNGPPLSEIHTKREFLVQMGWLLPVDNTTNKIIRIRYSD